MYCIDYFCLVCLYRIISTLVSKGLADAGRVEATRVRHPGTSTEDLVGGSNPVSAVSHRGRTIPDQTVVLVWFVSCSTH